MYNGCVCECLWCLRTACSGLGLAKVRSIEFNRIKAAEHKALNSRAIELNCSMRVGKN